MPYTTLRSTRPCALATSLTPRRSTPETSRGSRRWIFMSATPSLDALLGRSASRREHSAVVTWAQARGHLLWGSGAGRRVLRVDVHPGPPARAEDHRDATIRGHLVLVGALYLLGREDEHGARDRVGGAAGEPNDRVVLLPAQRHGRLVLDFYGGLGKAGKHVPLARQPPAKGGELNRLELQRAVREEELRLVHVVCRLANLSIGREGTSSRQGARHQPARRPRDDSGRGTIQGWHSACAERTLASAEWRCPPRRYTAG